LSPATSRPTGRSSSRSAATSARRAQTGRPLDAAFAHVLSIRNGRVASLVQITDTQRWHEAAA
jgi:ketosteroid isomerase-like protein